MKRHASCWGQIEWGKKTKNKKLKDRGSCENKLVEIISNN